jgi:hypothetical protein
MPRIPDGPGWTGTFLLALAVAVTAPHARAADPWEGGGLDDDFAASSANTLTHGAVQQHDLDQAGGPPDRDWIRVPTVAGHSYEARVTGVNIVFDPGDCGGCAQFERVAPSQTILQEDDAVVTAGPRESYDRTLRWVATATQVIGEYVRVTGDTGIVGSADSVYTLRFWDTTYAIPRWNAANGQATVFLIQNAQQTAVTGSIRLFSAAGALLHEEPLALDENGLRVFNVAGVPALVGQSGHAYVAHTAGYGGLAGKAVALEPATGFTFDTPMQPIPD